MATPTQIQCLPAPQEGLLRVIMPHGDKGGAIVVTFTDEQARVFLSQFAHALAIVQGLNPDDPDQPMVLLR